VRIIEKHIWLSVGHGTARQFQYWKKGDRRATASDKRNFSCILSMDPAEFIDTLKNQELI
jgi:hypothetical protein